MANGSLTPAEVAADLQGPAHVAPPGVSYNLNNPDNTLFTCWALTLGICFGISTLAVLMRLYTRLKLIKMRGLEDCESYCPTFFPYNANHNSFSVEFRRLVHLHWLCYYNNLRCCTWWRCASVGCQIRRSDRCLLRMSCPYDPSSTMANEHQLQFTYLSELLYGIMMLLLKTSILLQYRRVFTPMKKSDLMFWGNYLIIAIISVYYLAITFLVAFQCSPIKKAWNHLLPGGHCVTNENINISSGYFNAITDFAILLLPYKVIWNLQMPLQRKAAVSGIFLVGLLWVDRCLE